MAHLDDPLMDSCPAGLLECVICQAHPLDVPDDYPVIPPASRQRPLLNESAHLLWTCQRGHGNVTRAVRRGLRWRIDTTCA
jgi:hypothetical protein